MPRWLLGAGFVGGLVSIVAGLFLEAMHDGLCEELGCGAGWPLRTTLLVWGGVTLSVLCAVVYLATDRDELPAWRRPPPLD
jgi:hypothetical protein